MGAARALIEGPPRPALSSEGDALDDARRAGMDEAGLAVLAAKIARLKGRAPMAEFNGVWPQHVAAVEAFDAVSTQWRTSLSPVQGGFKLIRTGLDYAAAAVCWAALGITVTGDVFHQVQQLEIYARALLNGGELEPVS
jgi:Phage related hypothetical protein (DUF1799)